jgi:hydroxymethylpyrimidine pyrophosphatase-like HAD family hydrolase
MLKPLTATDLPPIRLIATDIDGTLTQQGKFTPDLLQALHELAAAGIPVLLVTGRSAGWVHGLAAYLPVVGAIAENGGLFYKGDVAPELLVPVSDMAAHRQQLAEVFAALKQQWPQIEETPDNRFRLTDWTFDVRGLSVTDLQAMAAIAEGLGWGFTYSTVQCHIRLAQQDKANGLEQVLQQHFPEFAPESARTAMVTVGDSPNDESMFNGDRFPLSVGVANLLHYADQIRYQPRFVAQAAEVAGFCELVDLVLRPSINEET